MKTTSIENFIGEIEHLLRNSNLEEALEKYCDYFGSSGQHANWRQIAESNLTRLRSYNISKRSGVESGEVVLNSIVSACWSILTDLKKASNYRHKEPFYSKIIPRKGKIQHNIPLEMRINDPEPCKVRVVVSKNVEIVSSPEHNIPNTTEAPVQILGEEGEVEISSVIADAFHIQLIPDLPIQHFLPKISTEWTFYVTPKMTGTHLLALNLVSNIRNNGLLTHQQVVYSITKEICVVNQPIAKRSGEMVTEGRAYVWKVPFLKYLLMWALVFLSYYWVPLAFLGALGGGTIYYLMQTSSPTTNPVGHQGVDIRIRPDKPLKNPKINFQDRYFEAQALEHGMYKIQIPKKWQNKTGILEIFDDQYTCFGTMPPKNNNVDCKCVKTPFIFKIESDSLKIPDEIVQISVDSDSLHTILGYRKDLNLYEANYYLAKREDGHTFEINTSTYSCTAQWKPGDRPNFASFKECVFGKKDLVPIMSSVSIRFILDRDLSNYTLIKPDTRAIEEYERTERTFGFSYQHDTTLGDSIFIVLSGTADGVPCICAGKESLRAVKNELKVYGKCTAETCSAIVELEFDVSNPTVNLYKPSQAKNPIWSKNLKLKGREILLPPLPQGEDKVKVQITGQDKSIHTVVITPNKNKIRVKASTDKKVVTLELDDFFRENLANEQLQVVDATTRRSIGEINVNSGNTIIYPAKGRPLDILWKTTGKGGNIATITVAKVMVNSVGGRQQVSCTPSSDLVKVVDLRQRAQKKSAKGTDPQVIFPLKN